MGGEWEGHRHRYCYVDYSRLRWQRKRWQLRGRFRRRLPLSLPFGSLKLSVPPAVTHRWAMFLNNINFSINSASLDGCQKRKAYIVKGHIPHETGMGYGWMGGRSGWAGGWPGRGPFSYLPPWQRPGWLYGRGACWVFYRAPGWSAPWYWYRPYYAPPYSYYPYAAWPYQTPPVSGYYPYAFPYWAPYWYPPYR